MLTELEIKHAKQGRHADGGCLYLKVTKTGSKSWVLRYKLDGKRCDMGLGPLAKVSAKAARELAGEKRRLIGLGISPLKQRQQDKQSKAEDRAAAARQAVTFDYAAEQFIEGHQTSWRNAKHRQQWKNTLARYASPFIGAKPVERVGADDIKAILIPIWHSKTETATRVRSRIELVLDFAKANGWRDGENPARWRGHLDKLLPKPTKLKAVQHHAALPWKLMSEFMTRLRSCPGVGARALEFAILTATRSGEVRLAEWSEIDQEEKLWTIPAHRMKARREHRVPLSEAALDVLKQVPQVDDESLVFPGMRAHRPLSDMTMTAVLKRMKHGDLTAHGFRSSFRDWAAEATHHQNHIVEMALAHVVGNAVEAAYRRGDLLDKRRSLMNDWAAHCSAAVADNVVELRGVA